MRWWRRLRVSDIDGVHLEVIDVGGGAVALTRRSPTLDGSVPLRAAQACTPLLEGNAFGLQVTLRAAWSIRRPRLGRTIVDGGATDDERRRHHRGLWPMLLAEGLIDPRSAWAGRFAEHPFVVADDGWLWLFTGLLVRPRAGLWLRQSDAGNRRCPAFAVAEVVLPDSGDFTPLVVALRPIVPRGTDVLVGGEVATLSVLQPGVAVERHTVAERPTPAARHLAFYNPSYFATKKGRPTRDYRRLVAASPSAAAVADAAPAAVLDIVDVADELSGPGRIITRFSAHLPGGPVQQVPVHLGHHAVFEVQHQLDVAMQFDGRAVTADIDPDGLQRGARAVEGALRAALGDEAVNAAPGAVMYLTKVVSLHPAGEPFCFTKPWSFAVTPPGWSVVLEGVHEDDGAFDVLRGVIRSDEFHATPAVLSIRRPGSFAIRRGQPLLRLWAVPNGMLAPRFDLLTATDDGTDWANLVCPAAPATGVAPDDGAPGGGPRHHESSARDLTPVNHSR